MRYLCLMIVFTCFAYVQDGHSSNLRCDQKIENGRASWYGPRFEGKPTASGEAFDPSRYTAAHPTLPFGTLVKVVNPKNDRAVMVRVNDRGNFAPERVIDLSMAAARDIGILKRGVANVSIYECNE